MAVVAFEDTDPLLLIWTETADESGVEEEPGEARELLPEYEAGMEKSVVKLVVEAVEE